MSGFDWNEYKEYRKYSTKEDKLQIAIDFIKSYYNMQSPSSIFDLLVNDDIGKMMLDKRSITTAEDLENFMFL